MISSWLFKGSILNYSNERIHRERLERAFLPWHQKIWHASLRSLAEFPKSVLITVMIRGCLNLLATQAQSLSLPKNDSQISHSDISTLEFVVLIPILEELAFRGTLIHSVRILQKSMQAHVPASLKGKVVEWLASDYARILLVQSLFAAVHLQTNYQSTFGSVVQTLGIFLGGSSCTIEYETTNSLMASTAFHITNNALVHGIASLAASYS